MTLPVAVKLPAEEIVDQLIALQREIRQVVMRLHTRSGSHDVSRSSAADTIYAIDADVEPVIESFCAQWAKKTPLVLIAEGIESDGGQEGVKVFPLGTREEDAHVRVIIDPIDGTRGIMYDKRSAWSLAGVAPNNGPATRLRDIEIAAMTELPTSKMGAADVLWAIKGDGVHWSREDLRTGEKQELTPSPSRATFIDHGFATIADFFPGTKVLAGETMEHLVRQLIGPADVTRATVFEDQYISTGGQFYEMIAGHDRFIADLRPMFYRMQNQPAGLCCHPYDCATMLVAEEAGVIITDGFGAPLDGPLDVTSGLSWAAYANADLRRAIEPLLSEFLRARGGRATADER